MAKSQIEWTGYSWNPITGCTKISDGCRNCYAERMAKRLQAMGRERYRNGFELTIHEDALETPLKWKKEQMVFVCSMSDLFHEDVPLEFMEKVFTTMHEASWHKYQVLTKRAERLLELDQYIKWTDNIWAGVTVESAKYVDRIDCLRQIGAKVKFLSLEPLIGYPGEIDLEGIDWVIVGGESGPGSRKIEESWVKDIRDQCLEAETPFFFKQWGGMNKKKAGRVLEGRTWSQFPNQPVENLAFQQGSQSFPLSKSSPNVIDSMKGIGLASHLFTASTAHLRVYNGWDGGIINGEGYTW